MTMPDIERFAMTEDSETGRHYAYRDDRTQVDIHFDKEHKTYWVMCSVWRDNEEGNMVPMSQRPNSTKHSSAYGRWTASQVFVDIPLRLHCFITKNIKQLGWGFQTCMEELE